MDLLPGQYWEKEIPKALRAARFIIIFFSNHSVSKRGYVQREFKLALDTLQEIPEGELFVIPVRLDACKIPEVFSHIHYVDLFESDGFDLVLKVLGMQIGQTPELRQDITPTRSSNQFTDPRDGQVYKTVDLLSKTWMAQNLNFDVGAGCWFYYNNPKHGEKYGRLYTWEAAKRACPAGWRLPSDEEWMELVIHFGGYYDWENSKDVGRDLNASYKILMQGGKSGFDALLGGYRGTGGSFLYLGANGSNWSATENGGDYAYNYFFDGGGQRLYRDYVYLKGFGLSVRCLQN